MVLYGLFHQYKFQIHNVAKVVVLFALENALGAALFICDTFNTRATERQTVSIFNIHTTLFEPKKVIFD